MLTMFKDRFQAFFTPRRRRDWREYITGYLFIGPAVTLIFIFGIFPVGFALYVSLHKWRIIRGDYLGVNNYVRAVGNVTYVVMFFLAVGALFAVYMILRKIIQASKEENKKPWILALPGLLHAAAVFALLRYIWYQLPQVLDIAELLRGQEKTRELFMELLGNAFKAVSKEWDFFLIILILAVVIGIVLVNRWQHPKNIQYQSQFMLAWLALVVGIGLIWFTYTEIIKVYTEAVETNTDPGIWPQVITISSGLILLVIGWFIWNGASKEVTNKRFWLRILAALGLLVGGWILIGELPQIIASGDEDLWNGLKVTVFFSVGTVPFQLAISMFLAILLFQKLRGSEVFRMVFFLPYVTPFIASAVIFRQIFANRDTALMNLIIRSLGGEGLAWLQESRGVLHIIGEQMGFDLPAWAGGPSLALIVVIIHSVWTYVGYDTVIYLAGLGNIPEELNEAAAIDGANKWDVFRHITFPLLSPTTYFLSLIAIIGTFKAFATLWIFRESLALGTTDTFSVAIFLEFFDKLRYGYASALAFVLFAIILSLTYINNRVQGSRVFYG